MARRKAAAVEAVEPGISVEDLFELELAFDMTYRGRPLHVVWAPERMTAAAEERFRRIVDGLGEDDDDEELEPGERLKRDAERDREEIRAIAQLLATILVSWSLRERDGSPVATTEERLFELPKAFLRSVFTALSENAGPKEASESPSDATS